MDGHLAAAVQTCLQGASDTNTTFDYTTANLISRHPRKCDSQLLDLVRCSVSDIARVQLRLAAVPQVDDGFVDVEQDHGGPGAQAAAVASHFQQVALHRHLAPDAVQAPFAWTQTRE